MKYLMISGAILVGIICQSSAMYGANPLVIAGMYRGLSSTDAPTNIGIVPFLAMTGLSFGTGYLTDLLVRQNPCNLASDTNDIASGIVGGVSLYALVSFLQYQRYSAPIPFIVSALAHQWGRSCRAGRLHFSPEDISLVIVGYYGAAALKNTISSLS